MSDSTSNPLFHSIPTNVPGQQDSPIVRPNSPPRSISPDILANMPLPSPARQSLTNSPVYPISPEEMTEDEGSFSKENIDNNIEQARDIINVLQYLEHQLSMGALPQDEKQHVEHLFADLGQKRANSTFADPSFFIETLKVYMENISSMSASEIAQVANMPISEFFEGIATEWADRLKDMVPSQFSDIPEAYTAKCWKTLERIFEDPTLITLLRGELARKNGRMWECTEISSAPPQGSKYVFTLNWRFNPLLERNATSNEDVMNTISFPHNENGMDSVVLQILLNDRNQRGESLKRFVERIANNSLAERITLYREKGGYPPGIALDLANSHMSTEIPAIQEKMQDMFQIGLILQKLGFVQKMENNIVTLEVPDPVHFQDRWNALKEELELPSDFTLKIGYLPPEARDEDRIRAFLENDVTFPTGTNFVHAITTQVIPCLYTVFATEGEYAALMAPIKAKVREVINVLDRLDRADLSRHPDIIQRLVILNPAAIKMVLEAFINHVLLISDPKELEHLGDPSVSIGTLLNEIIFSSDEPGWALFLKEDETYPLHQLGEELEEMFEDWVQLEADLQRRGI